MVTARMNQCRRQRSQVAPEVDPRDYYPVFSEYEKDVSVFVWEIDKRVPFGVTHIVDIAAIDYVCIFFLLAA